MEETISKRINDRPDSVEIGTPSKGGAIKVYFDAKGDIESSKKLVDHAIMVRSYIQEKSGMV